MTVQQIVSHTSFDTPSKPFPQAAAGTMRNVRVLHGFESILTCAQGSFGIPSWDFDIGEIDISQLQVSSPFPLLITFITY